MRLGSILVLYSFLNVQLFALIVGVLFIVSNTQPINSDPSAVENSFSFMAYIIVAAIAILIVLKYYKGKMLFYILELALVFITSWTFFSLFLNESYGLGLAIVAVIARLLFKQHRNIFLLFSSSVIGALLGISFDILPAAVFAILLSVYDYAAVFLTKHMITLAEGLRSREASFSISFPSHAPSKSKQRLSQTPKKGYRAVKVESIELGTGDLVIPAMLIVSALKLSLVHAFITLLGSVAGITLLFYYIEKRKGYWPALPPIVGLSLAFLLVYMGVLWFMG
ncbi:hypothetical protein KJ765_02745 [Candidatus Micrarchaeota archaeon]|nr:hypothetical protein [Candidatus Micrarchaeota archaeon]